MLHHIARYCGDSDNRIRVSKSRRAKEQNTSSVSLFDPNNVKCASLCQTWGLIYNTQWWIRRPWSTSMCLCMKMMMWLADMHLWRSDFSPIIRYAQFDFCRRLIIVPLTTFHRLAEAIGDHQGELIFLFNTGRCGSTLVTQVRHLLCQWLSV